MQARNRSVKTGLLPALHAMLAAILMTSASLLVSTSALALGLGDLTLASSLNEPLRATIALEDLDGLDLIDLNIRLGSVEDYDSAGLQRDALLTNLDFEVIGDSGRGQIIITSTRSINEPFLNLILIANWPAGRLVREYTILLDLPGTAPVNTPATPPSPAISAAVPAPGAVNATPGSATYTVQTGDTLYQIAEQTRPGSDVSVRQMMIALQRSNEDAFVNNNINRIITGRVLRIPPMQEIRLIDQEAANAQVNAQNQALTVQPLAGPGAAGGGGAAQDELTLLSGDAASGAGSSDLEATIAALENELMLSEENLDRARLENEELNSRLASLDEEIELLQNIIAIEDERLAQLQSELAAQAEAAARVAAAAQASSNSMDTASGSQPAGLLGQIIGALQSNVVSLAAVLVLVLLILGFLVVRRRRAEAADAADFELGDYEEHVQHVAAVRLAESDLGATEDDESDNLAGTAAATGFLGGLLARFRRKDAEEDTAGTDEDLDDDASEEFLVDDGMDDEDRDTPAALEPADAIEDAVTEEDSFELIEEESTDLVSPAESDAASAAESTESTDTPDLVENEIQTPIDMPEPAQSVELVEPSAGEADAEQSTDDALDALESALDEIESFDAGETAETADEEIPEIEFAFHDDEDSADSAAAPTATPEAAGDYDEADILTAALDAVDFDDTDEADSVTETGAPEAAESPTPEEPASAETEDAPETVDFNVAPAETASESEATAATSQDDTETFEFALKEQQDTQPAAREEAPQEEVETFAFELTDDAASAPVQETEEEAAEPDLDVISFDPVDEPAEATTADAPAASPATEDELQELEEIAFDDSMLLDDEDTAAESEDEEESAYTPRTNMDECDTKLDLAVAYEAMGDLEGAIEILDEVIADGNEKQIGQAQKLKAQWQDA
jgi:pilus assembly protein FimV